MYAEMRRVRLVVKVPKSILLTGISIKLSIFLQFRGWFDLVDVI